MPRSWGFCKARPFLRDAKQLIYHITQPTVWAEAQATGEVVAESLATEGFIHCSREAQLLAVANRFFAGADELLVLAIDDEQVAEWLVYEGPTGINDPFADDVFPHVYNPIPTKAIVAVAPIFVDERGRFRWSEELPRK